MTFLILMASFGSLDIELVVEIVDKIVHSFLSSQLFLKLLEIDDWLFGHFWLLRICLWWCITLSAVIFFFEFFIGIVGLGSLDFWKKFVVFCEDLRIFDKFVKVRLEKVMSLTFFG